MFRSSDNESNLYNDGDLPALMLGNCHVTLTVAVHDYAPPLVALAYNLRQGSRRYVPCYNGGTSRYAHTIAQNMRAASSAGTASRAATALTALDLAAGAAAGASTDFDSVAGVADKALPGTTPGKPSVLRL